MTSVLKPEAYKLLSDEIEERGIKRNFIAKKIGVTPNYLGSVLNGKRALSTDLAIRVSQELDIPFDIFLNKS
mgnify:CR=1 FL=1